MRCCTTYQQQEASGAEVPGLKDCAERGLFVRINHEAVVIWWIAKRKKSRASQFEFECWAPFPLRLDEFYAAPSDPCD